MQRQGVQAGSQAAEAHLPTAGLADIDMQQLCSKLQDSLKHESP